MSQWILLLAVALLSGCAADDQPATADAPATVALTAELCPQQIDGVGVSTRTVSTGLHASFATGETFRVQFPSGVTVGASTSNCNTTFTRQSDGTYSAATQPYMNANAQSATVHAYYPASYLENTSTFSVQVDQTTDANYLNSDLMYATTTLTKQAASTVTGNLTFQHRMAKILVQATVSAGLTAITRVRIIGGSRTVSLHDATTCTPGSTLTNPNSANGTAVTLYDNSTGAASVNCTALLPPQTVSTGTSFLEVTAKDANGTTGTAVYELAENKTFASGYSYIYTINTTLASIGTTTAITAWSGGGEIPLANNGTGVLTQSMLETPLTLEATVNNTMVTFTAATIGIELTPIQYSLDNGATWKNYTTSVTLMAGQSIQFRGNNATYATGIEANQYSNISCTGDCYVYGNIMSLVDSVGFASNTTLTETYTFCKLFSSNTRIFNHLSKELVLPAKTLTTQCYGNMFSGCTSLTTAPELPATTLAKDCYDGMFSVCTGLTTAPELPATTLARDCYTAMFLGCTGLTTAPELPATTLAERCYNAMFSRCTGLTTAPELPATTLAENCYSYMFAGCTGLTTAPELPATTLAGICYNRMFSGCTSLEIAPELPATTLAWDCYELMFSDCTRLTTAPELPATTLAGYCYSQMFSGCTSLATAPALPATTLADHCYEDMFSGCTNLNSVTCLATDISANGCTSDWLQGVAATGTFTKAARMTDWSEGASGIPSGWTVVNQ